MAKEVIMPKFGFTQETGQIVRWIRQSGDVVEQGDPLAEVTTDKVNMEVEAPVSGILDGIAYKEGDVVPVTEVIAFIRAPDETLPEDSMIRPATSPVKKAETQPQPAATPVAARIAEKEGLDLRNIKGSGPGGRITREDVEMSLVQARPINKPRATPAARRAARERGIDLSSVKGSGPQGRVQSPDIANLSMESAVARGTLSIANPEVLPPSSQAIPWVGIRRTIGLRMQKSMQEAPHITFVVDVDMTLAESLRSRANETIDKGHARVTLTSVIVKACAWALQRTPIINSQLRGEEIVLLPKVNVGVAVAIADGLIVPVVHDADGKGIVEVAEEIAGFVERARANHLRADDLADGTFTVSNLGMHGIDRFTAIINPPETAIVAVGAVTRRPVAMDDDRVVVRPMASLTLSADHRVVDGLVAARFLTDIKRVIQEPTTLLL